jgi:hypothetical protein
MAVLTGAVAYAVPMTIVAHEELRDASLASVDTASSIVWTLRGGD